jgi:hypothetical protein
MSITLVEQVRRLSTEEKRDMLELIRADLAMEDDDVPEWHKAVVAQRLADYRSGKEQAVNFDELVSEWRKTNPS